MKKKIKEFANEIEDMILGRENDFEKFVTKLAKELSKRYLSKKIKKQNNPNDSH